MTNLTYVLDTSAIVHDPLIFKNFPNSTIIIPIAVVSELDKLKKQQGEVGKNARIANRLLDQLSESFEKDLNDGIKLENNSVLKFDTTFYSEKDFAGFGDPSYGDTQILICAYVHLIEKGQDVTLVSNDVNLKIKARPRGIKAISYDGTKNNTLELYSGFKTVLNTELGARLYNGNLKYSEVDLELNPNEFIVFKTELGKTVSIGKRSGNEIRLVKRYNPWQIKSRNDEQTMALDLLMDNTCDLVTLIGEAGTGKSLIAIAAALELVLQKKSYEKLIIYKPIAAVGGQELGFMPGDLREKLDPWFTSTWDTFEYLFGDKKGPSWKKDVEMYIEKGQIELSAMTYVRGRSVKNAIILIDEVQNLTPQDVKTIVTRVGENSRIFLLGDTSQIDNDRLNFETNGLSKAVEAFAKSDISGHVTLIKGERSRLATLAAEIL